MFFYGLFERLVREKKKKVTTVMAVTVREKKIYTYDDDNIYDIIRYDYDMMRSWEVDELVENL